ncbi:hypothetical protein F5876DRAFT_70436 [Lentinula aff. lateritia]|uniref:Uncharacterized protein n=1 Tax=Lentinula aff. lateritia TaxID=2804960 RepID=A0ACC1TIV2_9AGAR|nr:hypothetical protein F5876DRAFT_70436 [Lentinula aff. lateritia]
MSGPARRGSRSAARSLVASPYARPVPKSNNQVDKPASSLTSSWSLSGIFNYLNPLRLRYQHPQQQQSPPPQQPPEPQTQSQGQGEDGGENLQVQADGVAEEEKGGAGGGTTAAHSLSARGHQITHSLSSPAPLPPPATPFTFTRRTPPPHNTPAPPAAAAVPFRLTPAAATPAPDDTESQTRGLAYLSKYLGERPRDEPLTPSEAEEMIMIIKGSTPVDQHETFRFSNSTTNNAPNPNPNPTINTIPFSFSPSYLRTPRPSTPRLLKHNPNGTYRWDGSGSPQHPHPPPPPPP